MNGYPRLYIGVDYIRQLKGRATFPINQVFKEELSDFISYYSSIKSLPYPLVIEDVSNFNEIQQSILLKFVEDSELKIILLASEDNILSTILSRMSLVYKQKENVKSLFHDPFNEEVIMELSNIDSDSSKSTYIKKQITLSPISYYYDQLLENKNNKNKLIRLLEKTKQGR